MKQEAHRAEAFAAGKGQRCVLRFFPFTGASRCDRENLIVQAILTLRLLLIDSSAFSHHWCKGLQSNKELTCSAGKDALQNNRALQPIHIQLYIQRLLHRYRRSMKFQQPPTDCGQVAGGSMASSGICVTWVVQHQA